MFRGRGAASGPLYISLLSAILGFAVAGLSSHAHAQVSLIDGLGGTADYGTECLGSNDDGSSREVDLTPIFPSGLQFFDETHTTMYVNTNGNITFSGQVSTYTPEAFPVADQPMIAPYWADVDIRGTECAEPDGGSGYAGDCHDPASNGVWWHIDTAGERVIVTWDRVGYYQCHEDLVMSFQLILTPAPTESCGSGGGADFDVEFRFNQCEWNTGDASGGSGGFPEEVSCFPFGTCPFNGEPCSGGTCEGIAAQAGFDAGNEMDFVEIMGSRTDEIHNILCTDSNVGEPGIWRFQIRSGVVVCPGAGEPCDTGMDGVCAEGRTQCVADGTECRPVVEASDEDCDALDNDCDGSVDEGDSLCASDEVCDRGVCVGRCFEGGCGGDQVCTSEGRCVDAGCEDMDCPAGERCVDGSCVGACDGVTCPAGLTCRGGRCVDLCADATCDDCTVCEDGACVPKCEYEPCESGETCLDDGHCVDSDCADVSCADGEVCEDGSCVDACEGASCPLGETCMMGECVADPDADAGVPPPPDDAGTGTDAGPVPPLRDSGSGSADGGGDGDAGSDDGRRGASDPGCACGTTGQGAGGPTTVLGLALVALLWWRRRR